MIRRHFHIGALAAIFVGLAPLLVTGYKVAADDVVRDDLTQIFSASTISGGIAVFDPETGDTSLVNQDWTRVRAAPAGTFNMFTAMLALDQRAVSSTRSLLKSAGDDAVDLATAVRASRNAAFQDLAKKIGPQTFARRLDAMQFGNAEVGSDVTSFWLNGPLAITPIEYAKVLAKLALGQLGFTDRAGAFIRSVTLVEEDKTSGRKLHALAGRATGSRPPTGWYVGWLEDADGKIKSFALLAEIRSEGDADKLAPLAQALLKALAP